MEAPRGYDILGGNLGRDSWGQGVRGHGRALTEVDGGVSEGGG